jgi:hypothetical protein
MFPTNTSSTQKPILPKPPAPKPPAPPAPEAELQVAPSREYKAGLDSHIDIATEAVRLIKGPGDALNLMSGKKFREVRSQLDLNVPYTGVHAQSGVTPSVQDVPNPDSPDGKWDPTQFMPRFVFDKAEDAFPVAPNFDGDTDLNNNAPEKADGAPGSYEDGKIGGDQPLTGAFTATKKGEYTVLTYSFYHAQNKAGHYHRNDYSTAQVYLKPGPDGKLAPTHLSTSWHHGSVLTPWNDMKQDDQGRPVVKVNLGSHALEVMDKDAEMPTEGLQIDGNGQATLNGEPTGHELHFEALQTNVKNAKYLDPKSEEAQPRLKAMQWGEAAMNPFLPEVYRDAPTLPEELLARGYNLAKDKAGEVYGKVEDKVSDGYHQVEDVVSDGVDKVQDVVSSGVDKVEDVASDAKDTVTDLASDGKDVADKAWGEIKGLFS